MNLIPAICTKCEAMLSVEKDKDTMRCPYCNAVFDIKEAVQKFNNTYKLIDNE